MSWRIAADAVLLLHAGFVVFVMLGALGALRWRWWPLLHLPAAAWGIWIEASGGLCPLTGLEDHLRRKAGAAVEGGSFVERTLLPLIYPEGLTRPTQWMLAAAVVLVNAGLYAWLLRRRRISRRRS